jgi:hypothetical protein
MRLGGGSQKMLDLAQPPDHWNTFAVARGYLQIALKNNPAQKYGGARCHDFLRRRLTARPSTHRLVR